MSYAKNAKGLFVPAAPAVLRRSLGRHRTVDTSIQFRMGAGVAGDVNRGHPASIQPCLNSPVNPVNGYGVPVVVDATNGSNGGVRPIQAGDVALTNIWGVTARPYPIQQATTSQPYGAVPYGGITPPSVQPIDVLRGGYIMVQVNGACVKGGAVFIWAAASGGGHTQGGFEIVASAGNTLSLGNGFSFNSPPDSNGIAELICPNY
jgi:hypothetical protein